MQSETKNPKSNHRRAGNHAGRTLLSAAFELDLRFFRGRVRGLGAPTSQQPYFANTSSAGARLVVVEIVLLGIPPLSALIANWKMFLAD